MTSLRLFASLSLISTITLLSGCAPTAPAKQAKAEDFGPAPQSAVVTTPESAEPQYKVVEIITKPVVVTQPTTTSSVINPSAPVSVNSTGNTFRTPPSAPTPKLTLDAMKKIDTSISTAPLVRLLVMKLNNVPYQQFAGFGALDFTPTLPEGTNPDAMTNDLLSREPAGTAGAIQRLIKKEVDVAFVSRMPNEAESASAEKSGARLRTDLIATEALVFTVNISNPVTQLSKQQLVNIFTAKTGVWKDLGPDTLDGRANIAGAPITVAYRAKGTGSEELLSQILLNGAKVPELPISKALQSTKLVLDASNEDPETIGFSVFAYASNMQRDGRIKVLAVDNVLPEPSRVANGTYPLTTPIYVVTRSDLPADSELAKLRTWLVAMPGQKLLAEAGYMPISPEAWTDVRLMGTK